MIQTKDELFLSCIRKCQAYANDMQFTYKDNDMRIFKKHLFYKKDEKIVYDKDIYIFEYESNKQFPIYFDSIDVLKDFIEMSYMFRFKFGEFEKTTSSAIEQFHIDCLEYDTYQYKDNSIEFKDSEFNVVIRLSNLGVVKAGEPYYYVFEKDKSYFGIDTGYYFRPFAKGDLLSEAIDNCINILLKNTNEDRKLKEDHENALSDTIEEYYVKISEKINDEKYNVNIEIEK